MRRPAKLAEVAQAAWRYNRDPELVEGELTA